MLYKFKSDAAPDLIMLAAHGKLVLEIIGKDFGHAVDATGIITPEQMPQAIRALKLAMQQADSVAAANSPAEIAGDNSSDHEATENTMAVTLRQRATPFLQMLERCVAANAAITWGG